MSEDLDDEDIALVKACLRNEGLVVPATTIRRWSFAELDRVLEWCGEHGATEMPNALVTSIAEHGQEYGLRVIASEIGPYQREMAKTVSRDIFKPSHVFSYDGVSEGMCGGMFMLMRIIVAGKECLNSPVDACSFYPSSTAYPDGYPLPFMEDGTEVGIEVMSQLELPSSFSATILGRIVRKLR